MPSANDDPEEQETAGAGGGDAAVADEGREPTDVSREVFGAGAPGTRGDLGFDELRTERERQAAALIGDDTLPRVGRPERVDASANEHDVVFAGARVRKYQKNTGYVPDFVPGRGVIVREALPSEYLARMDLQNGLFGDGVRVVGLSDGRFVISQPTLVGRPPTRVEIEEFLRGSGWRKIPVESQLLVEVLTGTAWYHPEEHVMLLDAKEDNFLVDDAGLLRPIDLMLSEAEGVVKRVMDNIVPGS